jgi:hypothetical protein
MLGAAWSAFHLGDNRQAALLAADGIACARQAGEPQLEVWGRNLLAGLACTRAMPTGSSPNSNPARPGYTISRLVR